MLRMPIRTSSFLPVTLALAALVAIPLPAQAQVVQSLQVGVGGFIPRGFDSRVGGDVLVEDLSGLNPLAFRIKDFNGAQVLGEWNVAFGNHIEFGAGLGYYQRRVSSVYRDLVNANGNEITQSLHLRIVPITGVVRFLPFGRAGTFQPYVGVGVSNLNFRYSETGEFVDPSDNSIFSARYIATGNTVAPVLLGGVRMPIKGDVYAFTFESRYQFGSGKTGGPAKGFLNNKIDLSGNNVMFGFLIRF